MLDALHDRGMTPFVTLHHFTSPLWFAAEGGWTADGAPDRFRRFAEEVARALGDRIPFLCTINEPQIVAVYGHQFGVFPPGMRDRDAVGPVTRNFIRAHAAGLEAFGEHAPDASVGLVLSVTDFQAVDEASVPTRDRIHRAMVGVYLDALRDGVVSGIGADDELPVLSGADGFVGINYYSRSRIDASSSPVVIDPPAGAETTQMGYEVIPESFVPCLKEVAGTGLPVYVTENGIGTDDDLQRVRFVARHLEALRRAMDEGVDCRGYLYWSSMDNFEWAYGYTKTFGLVAVDRDDLSRHPKASARYFGEIARANAVDPDLTRRYLAGEG